MGKRVESQARSNDFVSQDRCQSIAGRFIQTGPLLRQGFQVSDDILPVLSLGHAHGHGGLFLDEPTDANADEIAPLM